MAMQMAIKIQTKHTDLMVNERNCILALCVDTTDEY